MGLRKQLRVDCCCPPVVSLFYTTKSNRKRVFFSRFCFDACKANFLDSRGPRTKQSAWTFFGSERRLKWAKYREKHTPKSSLTTGRISTIQTIRLIKPMLITTQTKRIPSIKLIRQYTTQTAETKCRVGGLNGHRIIQNTMIK